VSKIEEIERLLVEAIKERYVLKDSMVGWLYPPIVQAEINRLQRALNELRKK